MYMDFVQELGGITPASAAVLLIAKKEDGGVLEL